MSELLYDLLGLGYWLAIVGGVVWWVLILRRGSRPRARTPREEEELAGLRAAIERGRKTSVDQPATADREGRQ